jgi:hypothetical protein
MPPKEPIGTLKLKKFKIKNIVPNATILLLGRRRCLQKGTGVLMFDGTIKNIEDINIGDQVMGDNSTPRNVLETHNGTDTMYSVTNAKGLEYTVNSEHILSLKYTGKKNLRDDIKKQAYRVCWFDKQKILYTSKVLSYKSKDKNDVKIKAQKLFDKIVDDRYVDIPVKEYLNLSKKYKNFLHGYQVPINFTKTELPIDPYMIGFWLGDGTSSSSEITTQDSTVVHYFKENLQQYKCYLQYSNNESNNKYKYRINGDGTGQKGCNYFLNTLQSLDLINNKHIPHIYKCNSRENRLKLLAGLIDSDGYLDDSKCCFDFVQKNEKLFDDVMYLCRSLGFSCYKSKQTKGCWYKNEYKEGDYFRMTISGNGIHEIPTMCPRKKAQKRIIRIDNLVSAITIKELQEKGEYYGIELDGNKRYVLDNFIITHNSGKSWLVKDIFWYHRDIPSGLIFSGTENANPFFGDFIPDSFIHSEYNPDLIEGVLSRQGRKVRDNRKLAKDTLNGVQDNNKLTKLSKDALTRISKDGLAESNRFFIVLDDMLADASAWKKEKTIQEIFFNGRHFNLFFILTMQYPLGIPPALRSNIDYVFVFNEPSISNRKKIWVDYGGVIPDFTMFCNILDECTSDHQCLVIKTSGNSINISDQVFYYKASDHDNFRVGHPKIWTWHDQNYNSKFINQKDLEQEKLEQLQEKYKNSRKLKVIVSKETGEIVDYEQESD